MMLGKLISAGLLFLFTLISGMIISRSGKPLNTGQVTVHKLLAICAIVMVSLVMYQKLETMDNMAAVKLGAVIITAVLFLSLITTGALLTRQELQLPAVVLKIHQVASILSLITSPITVFLILRGRA